MGHPGHMFSLCDYSGVMARPWAEAGYEAWCVDIEPEQQGVFRGIQYVKADVATWRPPAGAVVFACAFPPCTELATIGAPSWRKKRAKDRWFQARALAFVRTCEILLEELGCPWFIENPRGVLWKRWRKPDHVFNPCDYGDPYKKETWLWCGGGFIMPDRAPVESEPPGWVKRFNGTKDRSRRRSLTPSGFARAVFAANRPDARAAGRLRGGEG